MLKKEKQYPSCFGILENVFPKGEDGFRNTPSACSTCSHKTECLRAAMEGIGGLKMQEEYLDRAYSGGMIGFLERWSKKKDLNRRIKEKIKG
ncbi:MAG: hypothetical protein JW786_08200 [Desulfobacterales bacterium]|nr:hypothetical protein [Desulfobacterales bacterium]